MTTPPGWYPDPSGIPGTRYWDGQQWTGPLPIPPKKKSNGLLIAGIVGGVIVVGFIGLIVLGAIGASIGKNTPKSSTASSFAAPTLPSLSLPNITAPTLAKSTQPPVPAAMGQPATDGQTVFTVTSIDRSKIAGDPGNQFMQVTAQGEFLNVHLTVRNSGNQAQTFFASNQKLKLGGNTYEANGPAAMWTSAMNVPINPGNSIQATVSFDVPPGSSADGTVELHESVFSPGVESALG